MLIPSKAGADLKQLTSLSRRVNANSQLVGVEAHVRSKLIKKGEC